MYKFSLKLVKLLWSLSVSCGGRGYGLCETCGMCMHFDSKYLLLIKLLQYPVLRVNQIQLTHNILYETSNRSWKDVTENHD